MKLNAAARLEDRPLHLVERRDLLEPCFARNLFGRHPLLAKVLLDHLAVLDQDQGLRLEQRPHTAKPKAEVRGSRVSRPKTPTAITRQ
jgi:hypothetical protein